MALIRNARLHQMRLRGARAGAAAKAAAAAAPAERLPGSSFALARPRRRRPLPPRTHARQLGPNRRDVALMIAPCRPPGAGLSHMPYPVQRHCAAKMRF